ncbi:MAG: PepSY domain-containing protein [Actinobacteria bacterium]|nr:PepSY domain-containing protein [Actinomycetota bacterium]
MLALLAVLALAFVGARSCASSQGEISKEEAIEIARDEIDFEPDGVQVRNVAQGIPQRRVWAVSFYTGRPTSPERFVVVQIDARTGEVEGVARS